jgi:delta 1-pyrroline-5-carboxylate dehydrogenase
MATILDHARKILRGDTDERGVILPDPSVSQQTTNTTNEEYVMNDIRLLINGRLVKGASTLDVINPATGRTLTAAPRADRAQLEQAVAAAKTAFPAWSATPLGQRAALRVKFS